MKYDPTAVAILNVLWPIIEIIICYLQNSDRRMLCLLTHKTTILMSWWLKRHNPGPRFSIGIKSYTLIYDHADTLVPILVSIDI